MMAALKGIGIDTYDHDGRVDYVGNTLGRAVTTTTTLTDEECEQVIDRIRRETVKGNR